MGPSTSSATIQPIWRRIPAKIWLSLVSQPISIHLARFLLCLCVYSVELGTFWPHARRCRNQFSSEAATAPIQVSLPFPSFGSVQVPKLPTHRSILPLRLRLFTAQILVLTDPQIITTNPHPSYAGPLAKLFFPLHRALTDKYLARAWKALRRPGGGVSDWTATVWLGDLTDTGRLHYHDEG